MTRLVEQAYGLVSTARNMDELTNDRYNKNFGYVGNGKMQGEIS